MRGLLGLVCDLAAAPRPRGKKGKRSEATAAIVALIATAKMNVIDPQASPVDLVARIAANAHSWLPELLAWN